MEEFLYISFVRFSLQLVIAETAFVVKWEKRKKFLVRIVLAFLGYFMISRAIYKIFSTIPGKNPIAYTGVYMSLFFLTMCIMWVCFQVSAKEILFAGVCGYATQHIGFAFSTIAKEILKLNINIYWDFVLFRLLPYLLITSVIYFAFINRYEGRGELKEKDIRLILLSLVILFAVVILSVLVDSNYFNNNASYLRNVFCRIYAVISCILAIFVAYYLSRENRILRENEIMEEMLNNLKEQQKLSKENIDIINIKCHDLKYRISKIARVEEPESQKEYIESIKDAISIYDNIYQTGNDALDLVLTEKSLLCDKYNIKLSCMIDGEKLNFLKSTDVYALFGNLLDNAIEHVVQEDDEEKRFISIRVTQRNQGIHIHLENYCNKPIAFEDGLPMTTKEDKAYHGYGVKSIRYIVNKNKGDLLIQNIEQKFVVDIIFFPEQ